MIYLTTAAHAIAQNVFQNRTGIVTQILGNSFIDPEVLTAGRNNEIVLVNAEKINQETLIELFTQPEWVNTQVWLFYNQINYTQWIPVIKAKEASIMTMETYPSVRLYKDVELIDALVSGKVLIELDVLGQPMVRVNGVEVALPAVGFNLLLRFLTMPFDPPLTNSNKTVDLGASMTRNDIFLDIFSYLPTKKSRINNFQVKKREISLAVIEIAQIEKGFQLATVNGGRYYLNLGRILFRSDAKTILEAVDSRSERLWSEAIQLTRPTVETKKKHPEYFLSIQKRVFDSGLEIMMMWARLAKANGNTDEAIQTYLDIIKLSPVVREDVYRELILLVVQDDRDEAWKIYTQYCNALEDYDLKPAKDLAALFTY